jgi:hypothetical protein
MASIMKKVNGFAASPAGQAKIRHYMEGQLAKGKKTTASGAEVVSEARMNEAVDKFIQVLRMTAESYDLPDSVMEHIREMYAGKPRTTAVGCEVPLYFDGNLHRDSLLATTNYEKYSGEYGAYTGEGIDNIVALFNNGYHASTSVYGYWQGHNPSGAARKRDHRGKPGAWVQSRKDRTPLRFIQQAVDDFNGCYGSQYNVTVSIASIYFE